MGKLAERLADPSRSGVYRIRTTEVIEEAAALNGYSLLWVDGALPKQLPHVVLFEKTDAALLKALKDHATDARKRGECFFAALVDPEEKAALAPLYNERKS
ncbi:MAG TPA: hypothetical protein VFZ84_17315 [Burkholderiales bacterium]